MSPLSLAAVSNWAAVPWPSRYKNCYYKDHKGYGPKNCSRPHNETDTQRNAIQKVLGTLWKIS